jgi:hypothetical protein
MLRPAAEVEVLAVEGDTLLAGFVVAQEAEYEGSPGRLPGFDLRRSGDAICVQSRTWVKGG